MAQTTHANFRFTVKEDGAGNTWIMLEPCGGSLPCLGRGGFLGLELQPRTSIEQAHEIAAFLNDNITCVSHTAF
jgi:hypothetical protein